ncbi:hypothetical protein FXN61_47950 [Lentzea sp. PSKA42]|uniref:Uncharacterized protein n=1 Tax=Lentzea indica TaxID=2604800 RepID=A0ABX1FZX7_9PSEU|nr:hypothetical protein [Lentzea indica]NKE64021.1 hypothetical protein [Lentzea indica]
MRGRPPDDAAHLVVHADEPSGTALRLTDLIGHDEAGDAAGITRTPGRAARQPLCGVPAQFDVQADAAPAAARPS